MTLRFETSFTKAKFPAARERFWFPLVSTIKSFFLASSLSRIFLKSLVLCVCRENPSRTVILLPLYFSLRAERSAPWIIFFGKWKPYSLGVGPWAGEWLVPSYYTYTLQTVGQTKALHNLPLEVATGMGIPAMFLYIAMFFLPLRDMHRLWRSESDCPTEYRVMSLACLAAIPAYWAASLFNSGALVEVPYLFVALMIAIAAQSCRASWSAAGDPAEIQSGVVRLREHKAHFGRLHGQNA